MAAVPKLRDTQSTVLHIVVWRADTPRAQRRQFALEARAEIERAAARGGLPPEVAEECWRVILDPERV
jgi:hypothetical protein